VLGLNTKQAEVEKVNYFQYRQNLKLSEYKTIQSNYLTPWPIIPKKRNLTDFNKTNRNISTIPYKVLDAPSLQDDFYLNLLDWSNQNMLAVGLSSCVYLW